MHSVPIMFLCDEVILPPPVGVEIQFDFDEFRVFLTHPLLMFLEVIIVL